MTGIAGDITYAWHGLRNLLMTPVHIEQGQVGLQGVVKQ